MMTWINNNEVFEYGDFPQSGMCNMPDPEGRADNDLGIAQQQISYRLNFERSKLHEIGAGIMYERMLDKQIAPTIAEMIEYCAENAERFSKINDLISITYHSEQKAVFPYGNNYGWGIGHYKKKKLICNIFPENGAFTVMIRLTNTQYEVLYSKLKKHAQELIDNKYPCGDGGWIHYRVVCQEDYDDILNLIEVKCS